MRFSRKSITWSALPQRELAHQYFSTWEALAEANQRIWEKDYLLRPAYEPWDTWQAWLDAYREIVRDVQDITKEHDGRRPKERRP